MPTHLPELLHPERHNQNVVHAVERGPKRHDDHWTAVLNEVQKDNSEKVEDKSTSVNGKKGGPLANGRKKCYVEYFLYEDGIHKEKRSGKKYHTGGEREQKKKRKEKWKKAPSRWRKRRKIPYLLRVKRKSLWVTKNSEGVNVRRGLPIK